MLKDSENKLGLTFNAVTEGIIVTDRQGNIIHVNQAAVKLLGYNRQDEIIGQKARKLARAKDLPKVEENLMKTLTKKSPGTFKCTLQRKDGSEFYAKISTAAIQDAAGNTIGGITISRDITRYNQMKRMMEFSDAALSSLKDSVVATDTEYTITRWNGTSEQLYGITASEAIGQKLDDVIQVVSTSPAEWAETVKNLEASGHYRGEQLHRTRQAEVWVDVSIHEIKADHGKRYGWVLLALDITERKQYETKINHLNRLLSTILNINEFIVRIKDPEVLLKGVCDTLVESGIYDCAWMVLLSESRCITIGAVAGLGKDSPPVAKWQASGKLPDCCQKALESPGTTIIRSPFASCVICPLADKYGKRSTIAVRLEHSGKVYGVLAVSALKQSILELEEQSLLLRIAGDIALVLHDIDIEAQRSRAVDTLVKLTRFL